MMSFKVSGMSCGHCAAAVTRSIQERDPAAVVEVDLAQGRVAVQSALPQQELARAISDAGYDVAASPG
jgi:copper chaperone